MDKAKEKFETFEGVDIFITHEGRFTATVAGATIKRSVIAEIRKEITKSQNAVVAYDLSTWEINKPKMVEVLGFEKQGSRARLKGGDLASRREDFFVLRPAQLAELEDLYKQDTELQERWRKITGKLERLTAGNIDRYREQAMNQGTQEEGNSE